jgi:hypothetical protein
LVEAKQGARNLGARIKTQGERIEKKGKDIESKDRGGRIKKQIKREARKICVEWLLPWIPIGIGATPRSCAARALDEE